jgi:hypothetical protein
VSQDLYASLDDCFRPNEVDYEGNVALRTVRIKELPSILFLAINVSLFPPFL